MQEKQNPEIWTLSLEKEALNFAPKKTAELHLKLKGLSAFNLAWSWISDKSKRALLDRQAPENKLNFLG